MLSSGWSGGNLVPHNSWQGLPLKTCQVWWVPARTSRSCLPDSSSFVYLDADHLPSSPEEWSYTKCHARSHCPPRPACPSITQWWSLSSVQSHWSCISRRRLNEIFLGGLCLPVGEIEQCFNDLNKAFVIVKFLHYMTQSPLQDTVIFIFKVKEVGN